MPHVALSDGISTLDLAGNGFALVTASPAWADAAAGLPLAVHLLDDAKALGIGNEGALILRPDGVIGWRDDTAHPDAEAELRYAVALLAAREEAAQGDDLLPLHP
jgi:hypothetical protein